MSSKKKILILGGSDIQVSAIKKAKEMGLYVITCDYLPGNPGHEFSDEYHNISTTDKDKVLDISKKLHIDGILAYASDPAAPTAAYVAEKMGLPTNPFEVVEIMSRKDLFRKFLEENNFKVPKSNSFSKYQDALFFFKSLNKKGIIKPVDSSGSKGVFTIEKDEDFEIKFNKAISFSKTGLVIVEEFINKKGYQIGGDGFVVNGSLVFRCFGDIHFSKTNPVLPCSVSIPTLHTKAIVEKVHKEVQRLLTTLKVKMGALNFDILLDDNNNVFILEIGPRNGGNMIPELTYYSTGVEMKEYSIKACLGMDCSDLKLGNEKKYFSHYVIHSSETGCVKSVIKTDFLNAHLLYEHYNFCIGDKVEKFNSSANRLGIMLLQYESKEVMLDLIDNMQKYFFLEITSV